MTDLSIDDRAEANRSKWGSWLCNVRDHMKPMSAEEIKQELRDTMLPCGVLMQNIEGDFNFGNIVRSANNFGIGKIFYHGKRHWDKRSALGTYKYSDVTHLKNMDALLALKNEFVFVGVENNIGGCVKLKDFIYPANSLLVFGEENGGIDKSIIPMLDYTVEIPSMGSVRSLNVGSAASIVMYDYVSKYNEKNKAIR